jgi:4-amino-4-deoxy-L-arabinose transferase-like glycosyltransferase
MELWDESRTANNAIEMAKQGGWVVTTFGYVPDLWNTKPPLQIWAMAALLCTGMDPMLAIRLPSILATIGTVLLVFVSCRVLTKDRLAGLLGGLLVICSPLVMGDHVGRTGDYDALLCTLNLAFVLCAGIYIDRETARPGVWIGIAAVCLVLAVLTKGVAGGLAVPGLMVYAVVRRRFLPMLADWRLWLSLAAAVGGLAGWFALREWTVPGYLATIWSNDIAGRMLTPLDAHEERRTFYLRILVLVLQPAILFFPMLVSVCKDPDPARKRLCLLMGLTALSWLIALTSARTKLFWYAAPIVPLVALAIGLSASTWLRKSDPSRKRYAVLRPMVVALPILASLVIAFWQLNIRVIPEGSLYPLDGASSYAFDQTWYGPFLKEVRSLDTLDGTIMIDDGVPNQGGLEHYNPVARFFVEDAERRGERMRLTTSNAELPVNAPLLTCDPKVRRWLAERSFFTSHHHNVHCVFGRVTAKPNRAPGTE